MQNCSQNVNQCKILPLNVGMSSFGSLINLPSGGESALALSQASRDVP